MRSILVASIALLLLPTPVSAQRRRAVCPPGTFMDLGGCRPLPTAPPTPARPGSCLRWKHVIDKQGYYDNSRVEISNTCGQAVSAWQCVIAVYGPGSRGCDPRFGTYGGVTYAPGQVSRQGMPSNTSPTVDLLECPAATRPLRPLDCA